MKEAQINISFKGNQGIPAKTYTAIGKPKAILCIIHGLAEHVHRYKDTATYFCANGFTVYLPELIAHHTAQPEYTLGLAQPFWFNEQVQMIHSLILEIKNTNPETPVFLLGHSMGSFLCQSYVQQLGDTIDGLVLSASNGQEDPLLGVGIFVAKAQYKLLGKNHRSKLIDKLSFGRFNKNFAPNRTTQDWLSRDHEAVDKYVADPRCGFVCGAGFFTGLFTGVREVMKKSSINKIPKDLPVYCFAGGSDPVGLMGKGFMKLVEKWKAAGLKVDYDLYEGGRHEMLNEINKEEVRRKILEWMEKEVELAAL